MMQINRMTKLALVCAVVAGLTWIAPTVSFADCGKCSTVVAGTGLSSEEDAAAAGAEAAEKAKAALGKEKAKLVLVHDNGLKDKAALLKGVSSVFDPKIIYGCSAYGPITQEGNGGAVGVLALGGAIEVSTTIAKLEDSHKACGVRIGEALKDASQKKAKGQVLLLFGACHVPKDNDLTLGAAGVLGEKFPIIGGAASKGESVYYQGEVTEGKNNVGILISGNFTCGFNFIKDMSKEGLISSAGKAFAAAVGENKKKVVLMFAFDCGGRRGKMGDDCPKELEAMKAVTGDIPIFGFYGSGEIGRVDSDTASRGDGYHLSACAIIAP